MSNEKQKMNSKKRDKFMQLAKGAKACYKVWQINYNQQYGDI